MIRSMWQCLLIMFWASWWGGLTFYGLFVVREASEVVGQTTEGFVTQRVTQWLNWVATALIVLLLIEVLHTWRTGRPWRAVSAAILVMAAAQLALFALHRMLDHLVNSSEQTILAPERFHALHEWYLTITTMQWVTGIVVVWLVVGRPLAATRNREPSA